MPDLKRTQRLEPKFPQQGDGIGVAGGATDHPAADLAIALMKHGLQKGALHGSEPVDALTNQLLRSMQGSSSCRDG